MRQESELRRVIFEGFGPLKIVPIPPCPEGRVAETPLDILPSINKEEEENGTA